MDYKNLLKKYPAITTNLKNKKVRVDKQKEKKIISNKKNPNKINIIKTKRSNSNVLII